MTTPLQVVAARPEIGTVEKPAGSNRQKYGVWYGFNGVPWCAIFVSWCMAKAGLAAVYRFASVAVSIAAAKAGKNGMVWHPNTGRNRPKPGWIACKLYSRTQGHTGIVEAVETTTDVTIEGNTSGGDDRNGGIVMRRRRSRSFWTGWIEVPTPVDNPPAPHPPEDDDDMANMPYLVRNDDGAVALVHPDAMMWVADSATWERLGKRFGETIQIDNQTFEQMKRGLNAEFDSSKPPV